MSVGTIGCKKNESLYSSQVCSSFKFH